jgi:CDP-diacylglycerol--glycerol-3-phosphate 3-phosphatidyltransferase
VTTGPDGPTPVDGTSPHAPRRTTMRGRVFRKGPGPASNANIANIITVLRILLAPVFIWLLLLDGGDLGPVRWVAALLFIFAIATDGIDGFLARRNDLVTDLGILLDPIADKVLTLGALVALSVLGELWWWVTIVILVRELGITVYRFAVVSTVVIPASKGGKLKTLMQAVAISLFLLPFASVVGDGVLWVNWAAMAVALALTVYTGLEYAVHAVRGSRTTRA